MPRGGTLTLTAENLQLDETFAAMTPGARAGPHVCLKVADTGSGIPPEIQPKIFDPFFTTKEKGQGTGLGLATVLGITKNHGGFLRFASTVGRGTCFEIYLPATPAAQVAADGAGSAPPRGEGQTILVVDDDPAICAVTARILERQGYRPVCAADGSEAVAAYVQQEGAIAAVLTDMVMPGMDGPTLVRTLRRINPQLPVLGMTGYGERAGLEVFEALGLPSLLMKPFAADRLLTALHDALHVPPGGRPAGFATPWRPAAAAPPGAPRSEARSS
jgi:CheY-like chemotaxis protein